MHVCMYVLVCMYVCMYLVLEGRFGVARAVRRGRLRFVQLRVVASPPHRWARWSPRRIPPLRTRRRFFLAPRRGTMLATSADSLLELNASRSPLRTTCLSFPWLILRILAPPLGPAMCL